MKPGIVKIFDRVSAVEAIRQLGEDERRPLLERGARVFAAGESCGGGCAVLIGAPAAGGLPQPVA